ncbi:MAG: phosphotransferase [Proteobacteria bacterium]|nr:phosphotransferase [Pseudomonadota bacterium]
MNDAAAPAASSHPHDYEPAARDALAQFGVEPADIAFVRMSENVTFRVTDARDGGLLTLRLHRPWYHSIAELHSEHVWTRALVAAGIAVPEPLATLAGESFARVEVAATGEHRWAGLARWVDGELLSAVVEREPDTAANARRFADIGAIMAAMHDQASGWTPPPDFERISLDEDGLMGEEPRWGQFWKHSILSPAEGATLLAARDTLRAALARYGKSARNYSLIHADLHPGNVLVTNAGAAVIDFDDAGYGWHLYDIAVALVAYQDHPGFAVFRDACVAGYRSVRPLPDADLALLPMFLLIRDMAQLGWFHQRPELPREAAIRRHRERILERMPLGRLPV